LVRQRKTAFFKAEMEVRIYRRPVLEVLIGNQFHVKLCIHSPENCKQSLQVKRYKAKARAEKANKLKTKRNK